MHPFFEVESFVRQHVTKRPKSLLQSDLERYNEQLGQEINDKAVLVIGGAGTIGSNFIKALLHFKPKKLVVIDTNENGLTELVRDLRSSGDYHIPSTFITYPFSFGGKVFAQFLDASEPFDIVANFAAHKHVRSEKDEFAIQAMIENNILFTKRLLEKLVNKKPSHFFCVSTDKAANPVNIMGASKKLMEEVILAFKGEFKVTTARFANVAFSNGSLLDSFITRVGKRQPLPAPVDIYRYFVSPIESGQLCLLACIIGGNGDIIFPKLDAEKDVLSFASIAKSFLAGFGYEPYESQTEQEAIHMAKKWEPSNKKYPVFFFQSNTTGEKTVEEFYTEEEMVNWDIFTHLGVIKNAKFLPKTHLDHINIDFSNLFDKKAVTKNEIISLLNHYLPNFHHFETGVNLDQKM